MIKNVLEHIGGVGAYGVISILLFFTVFIGVIFRVARMNRSQAESMAAIPLDDGTIETSSKSTTHS